MTPLVRVRPGQYLAAVMEAEPGGKRLQTGWFRTNPPSDMLEWAIRHQAEDHPRLRVLYLIRAILPERPAASQTPVDIPRDASQRPTGEY